MRTAVSFFAKLAYVTICVFGVISLFSVFSLLKMRGVIREINLRDGHIWNKGKRLYVTNHPSWLDQFIILALRLPFWSTNYLPYVAVAKDSIKRLPLLKFLKEIYFLTEIERQGDKAALKEHVKRMKLLLENGHSLMMAGASGRDFKVDDEEKVFSPIKGKPLRQFTNLCGLLSVVPGVETYVLCIEGTDRFYVETAVNGKKEAKFSCWNFIVLFLILGVIKIRIIYSQKLTLKGMSSREAAGIIQNTALALLDTR